MTRSEQRRFVKELSRNVVKNVLQVLPDAPAEWGGHELRLLLKDHFEFATLRHASPGLVRRYNKDCRRLNLWGSR